ncbi:hypothetical protein LCGC14_1722030, partial [marine sediment metagenome]
MPPELQSGETIASFAQRIKQKYPDYAGVEDAELARLILEKYPMYRERVSLPTEPSALPPTEGQPQATIGPRKVGLLERVGRVFKEGIPQFSTRTVHHPKYGQSQILAPEEVMTPLEQQEHPIATGLLESAGGLTSPETVALIAGTGGLGTLPGVAKLILPRIVAAGFSAWMVHGAYKEYPEFKAAMDRGDESEALRIFTHLVAAGAFATLAGGHAVTGKPPALRPRYTRGGKIERLERTGREALAQGEFEPAIEAGVEAATLRPQARVKLAPPPVRPAEPPAPVPLIEPEPLYVPEKPVRKGKKRVSAKQQREVVEKERAEKAWAKYLAEPEAAPEGVARVRPAVERAPEAKPAPPTEPLPAPQPVSAREAADLGVSAERVPEVLRRQREAEAVAARAAERQPPPPSAIVKEPAKRRAVDEFG